MIEEIDLTKPIPEIAPCETYRISTLCLKSYNSHIQPGEAPIDLIYLDILGLFKIGLNGS